MEKGSIATWQAYSGRQYEVYSSKRTIFGSWSPAENISQTSLHSRYPQVAMYQTVDQTDLDYVWTEGNSSPYEVKIHHKIETGRGNTINKQLGGISYSKAIPLYAFNLGEEEPSVFNEHRCGYINYGQGFAKTVDYDSSFIRYVITGLDPARIYHVGLVLYQDEEDSIWQQGVEIDSELVKVVDLHRRRVVFERIVLSPETYEDGRISLNIRSLLAPKAVLAALAVWEFSKDNKTMASVQDFDNHIPKTFNIYASPNPARGNVLLHYQLSGTADISIKIYSVSGQLIREITENKRAGINTVIWDGKDDKGTNVAGGIYFYRVESKREVKTGKIVFLR